MGIVEDDRTAEQRDTHTFAVVGTDPFMSGWGKAANGASYAAWACTPGQLDECESRVRKRGDMNRVRIVALRDWRPEAAHTHIYVYKE